MDFVLISKEAVQAALAGLAQTLRVVLPLDESKKLDEGLSDESRMSCTQIREDVYLVARRDVSIVWIVLWFTGTSNDAGEVPHQCLAAIERALKDPKRITSRHFSQIRVRARTNVSRDELLRLADHYHRRDTVRASST